MGWDLVPVFGLEPRENLGPVSWKVVDEEARGGADQGHEHLLKKIRDAPKEKERKGAPAYEYYTHVKQTGTNGTKLRDPSPPPPPPAIKNRHHTDRTCFDSYRSIMLG